GVGSQRRRWLCHEYPESHRPFAQARRTVPARIAPRRCWGRPLPRARQRAASRAIALSMLCISRVGDDEAITVEFHDAITSLTPEVRREVQRLLRVRQRQGRLVDGVRALADGRHPAQLLEERLGAAIFVE